MIAQAIRRIFSAYRRDDFADSEGFANQLGTLLNAYSDSVIAAVTSPISGIQTRSKFPPQLAEIKEACEQEAAYEHRQQKRAALPDVNLARLPAPGKQPGHRAKLFVPATNRRYAEMVERTKAADDADWLMVEGGIKVALDWWSGEANPLGTIASQFATHRYDVLERRWT